MWSLPRDTRPIPSRRQLICVCLIQCKPHCTKILWGLRWLRAAKYQPIASTDWTQAPSSEACLHAFRLLGYSNGHTPTRFYCNHWNDLIVYIFTSPYFTLVPMKSSQKLQVTVAREDNFLRGWIWRPCIILLWSSIYRCATFSSGPALHQLNDSVPSQIRGHRLESEPAGETDWRSGWNSPTVAVSTECPYSIAENAISSSVSTFLNLWLSTNHQVLAKRWHSGWCGCHPEKVADLIMRAAASCSSSLITLWPSVKLL